MPYNQAAYEQRHQGSPLLGGDKNYSQPRPMPVVQPTPAPAPTATFGGYTMPDWNFKSGKNLAVNQKNIAGGLYQGITKPFAEGYAARMPQYFQLLDEYYKSLDPSYIPNQYASVQSTLNANASRFGGLAGSRMAQETGNDFFYGAAREQAMNDATTQGNQWLFQQYTPQAMQARAQARTGVYNPATSGVNQLYSTTLGYQAPQSQPGTSIWDTVAGLGQAAGSIIPG